MPLNDNWEMTVDGIADISTVSLPIKINENKKNNHVVIERTLPDDFFMGATLLFRTSQQFMNVYLDGKEIYTYDTAINQEFGKTPGSAWHFVRLPPDYPNKTITIEFCSPYTKYSKSINEIYFGTKSSHIFSVLTEYGINSLIGIILILVGFVGIFAYFIINRMYFKNISLYHLSLFSLCCGIWILCESRILQLFFNNPFFIYVITFISFFSIPIYFGYFILTNYNPKHNKNLRINIDICIAFFILAMILQFANLVDFIEILPFFHILLILSIISTIYSIVCELKYNKNIRILMFGIVVLSISTIIDIVLFYLMPNKVSGIFTQLGILIFVLMMGVSAAKYFVELTNTKAINMALEKLAYTDPLTGLKNRTAFQETLDTIDIDFDENYNPLYDLSIIMCDINNLKYVNDTFGHKEGDLIIKAFANIIDKAFGDMGDIYKIGGDEFAVLAHDITDEIYNQALAEVDNLVEEYNLTYAKTPLSIAIGIASYCADLDKDVNVLFMRSDAQMYKRKEIQKRSL